MYVDVQDDFVYYMRIDIAKAMNQPDIYQFAWSVPDGGYEIICTKEFSFDQRPPEDEDRFLVEPLAVDTWITRYQPLATQTGLFREFASLHPASEEDIVRFAGNYGWLGGDRMQTQVARAKKGEPGVAMSSTTMMFGERITSWQAEVATMEHLVSLWEATTGVSAKLAKVVTWEKNGSGVRYEGILGLAVIAKTNYREEFFNNLNAGELVRPTLDFVRTRVNKLLEDRGITNRLLWDPNYRRQRVHVVPTSLVAALWLQFAKAIEGDKEYRQCEQCDRWFEVAAEKREDAKFCQNACRSKAYRERQKTARKLRGEGVAVREIARRLDSDTKTITRWTKK